MTQPLVGPLYGIPIWLMAILVLALSLVAAEVGFRIGRRWQPAHPEETASGSGVVVGAALALLAFFLAVLVGMAVERFEARRAMIVEEANAIGTTWLRAGYLPEPHSIEVRRILRDYVDRRLDLVNLEVTASALSQSRELTGELWAHAEELAVQNPESESVALFVETVNQTIDVGAKRSVAISTWRIPWAVWLVIYVLIFLCMSLVGFHNGIAGGRHLIGTILLGVVLASVTALLIEFDRPYQGLLQVNQTALLELQEQVGVP